MLEAGDDSVDKVDALLIVMTTREALWLPVCGSGANCKKRERKRKERKGKERRKEKGGEKKKEGLT
jgi:hypothetical protein